MRFALGLSLATILIISVLSAATKSTAATSSEGKKIYATTCSTCHGPDGKGNSTGRALGVKDLHSPEALKMTNAQMKQLIANGRNNMPPWKGQLTEAQISEVAAFVRTLQKTK
jgi:cytochrome c oxidase cbb3-type subunit 3